MITCEQCAKSRKTTGWVTQLAGGCWCRIIHDFVDKKSKNCIAISELVYRDFLNAEMEDQS